MVGIPGHHNNISWFLRHFKIGGILSMNNVNLPNPAAVITGNSESNIGICTLWSQKELIASRLERDSFFICGNLYSLEGINQLIRAIFLNPWLRVIVICGEDMSRSGETLLKLFHNGVDDDNGIIGTNFKVDKNIPKDCIELMRQHVRIIDMRRRSVDELRQKINELSTEKLPAFTQPKEFPSAPYGVDYIPSELVGYTVRARAVGEAWLTLLDLIMKLGVEKKSEFGMRQKELLDVLVTINEDSAIPEYFSFSEEDLEDYAKQIVTPEKPEGVSYTYGARLFGNGETNQVSEAVERLKKSFYTRRAVASTWRLQDAKSDSPPCLMQISWNIQFNKLYQTATFRSWDIFSGMPINILALRKLQQDIAKQLGIECASLTCLGVSAHIYENNWQQSSETLEKYKKPDYRFYQDPRGSFVIRIEGNEIVADFYTEDGSKTQYSFRGTDVIKLYKEIAQSNLISRLDHAANLGMELYKASIAIRQGRKYVQDEELE